MSTGGGLYKDGGNALTLTGTNTYTGSAVVNAGTFALVDNAQLTFVLGATSGSSNRISGAGAVTLDGDFAIDTSAADVLSSGSWTLENVPSLTGAYGSNFTVVGFTDIGGDMWRENPVGSKLYTFERNHRHPDPGNPWRLRLMGRPPTLRPAPPVTTSTATAYPTVSSTCSAETRTPTTPTSCRPSSPTVES